MVSTKFAIHQPPVALSHQGSTGSAINVDDEVGNWFQLRLEKEFTMWNDGFQHVHHEAPILSSNLGSVVASWEIIEGLFSLGDDGPESELREC